MSKEWESGRNEGARFVLPAVQRFVAHEQCMWWIIWVGPWGLKYLRAPGCKCDLEGTWPQTKDHI